MEKDIFGYFSVMIHGAIFTRNTNIVNKMNPYIVVKQTKDKTKKQRKLYRGKKIIAKTPVCPKGHKNPVWKCKAQFPDHPGYKPEYTFKAMNKASVIGDEEIGRCVVDFTEIRELLVLKKVDYPIYFDRKVTGTICLSFKYTYNITEEKKDIPKETYLTPGGHVENRSSLPPGFEPTIVDGEQEYDDYIPCDQNEDNQGESKSSDDEYLTLAERNQAYHKRFLYFVPKSFEIYEYSKSDKRFNEISTQSEILHPQEMQATELPDGSYLLTGGRDALTEELTHTVVHYINEQYYRRSDLPI